MAAISDSPKNEASSICIGQASEYGVLAQMQLWLLLSRPQTLRRVTRIPNTRASKQNPERCNQCKLNSQATPPVGQVTGAPAPSVESSRRSLMSTIMKSAKSATHRSTSTLGDSRCLIGVSPNPTGGATTADPTVRGSSLGVLAQTCIGRTADPTTPRLSVTSPEPEPTAWPEPTEEGVGGSRLQGRGSKNRLGGGDARVTRSSQRSQRRPLDRRQLLRLVPNQHEGRVGLQAAREVPDRERGLVRPIQERANHLSHDGRR